MAKNFYGTVAALAWVIGHYFYNRKHYAFLAGEFYPYKLKNPRSSSPFMTYQDMYEPWRDEDDNSKPLNMYRLALWGGIEKKRKQGAIDDTTADRLKNVCNKINTIFFYPIVYRVDVEAIGRSRLEVEGSGLRGSLEYLVRDLDESEVDVLFLDFDTDADFNRLVRDEMLSRAGGYSTAPNEALGILERRCDSSGVRLPFSTP